MQAVQDSLGNEPGIWGAMVHGSLAEKNAIGYSDFDALVIIKSEVFNEPRELNRVASKLTGLTTWMRTYDPLQHHGWFVVPESLLGQFPEDYLPVAAMTMGRTLVGPTDLEINAIPLCKANENFRRIADLTIEEFSTGLFLQSAYWTKSTFSKFFLLPSLFHQAFHQRGICKRDSFAQLKLHGKLASLESMDRASRVRELWDHQVPSWTKPWIRRGGRAGKWIAKRYSGKVASRLLEPLGKDFSQMAIRLIESMKAELAAGIPAESQEAS